MTDQEIHDLEQSLRRAINWDDHFLGVRSPSIAQFSPYIGLQGLVMQLEMLVAEYRMLRDYVAEIPHDLSREMVRRRIQQELNHIEAAHPHRWAPQVVPGITEWT